MVANPTTTSVAEKVSNTSYFSRHGNISTRAASQMVDHSKIIQHYQGHLNQHGHAPHLANQQQPHHVLPLELVDQNYLFLRM